MSLDPRVVMTLHIFKSPGDRSEQIGGRLVITVFVVFPADVLKDAPFLLGLVRAMRTGKRWFFATLKAFVTGEARGPAIPSSARRTNMRTVHYNIYNIKFWLKMIALQLLNSFSFTNELLCVTVIKVKMNCMQITHST